MSHSVSSRKQDSHMAVQVHSDKTPAWAFSRTTATLHSEAYVAVRHWLGLDTHEARVEVQSAMDRLGKHEGVRGWKIFKGTSFAQTLPKSMQATLLQSLTYQELFELENICKQIKKPTADQAAFLKFVEKSRGSLVGSATYRADGAKERLLKHLVDGTPERDRARVLADWEADLNRFAFAPMTPADEATLRARIVDEITGRPRAPLTRLVVQDLLTGMREDYRQGKPASAPLVKLKRQHQREAELLKKAMESLHVIEDAEVTAKQAPASFRATAEYMNMIEGAAKAGLSPEVLAILDDMTALAARVSHDAQFIVENGPGLRRAPGRVAPLDRRLTQNPQEFETRVKAEIADARMAIRTALRQHDLDPVQKQLLSTWYNAIEIMVEVAASALRRQRTEDAVPALNARTRQHLIDLHISLTGRIQAVIARVGGRVAPQKLQAINGRIRALTLPAAPTQAEAQTLLASMDAIRQEIAVFEVEHVERLRPQEAETYAALDTTALETACKVVLRALDQDGEWKEWNAIGSDDHFTAKRSTTAVRQLMDRVLQQSPKGLILLKLRDLNNNPGLSPGELRLVQAAELACKEMFAKNYEGLKPKFEQQGFAAAIAFDELDTQPIAELFEELKTIWTEILPYEQEQELLAITNPIKQKEAMSRLFYAWVCEKTGVHFGNGVSFDDVFLRDRALAVTRRHRRALSRLATIAREKREAARGAAAAAGGGAPAPVAPRSVHSGFPVALMREDATPAAAAAAAAATTTAYRFPRNFEDCGAVGDAPFDSNLVYLKEHPFPAPSADVGLKIEWVQEAMEALTRPLSRSTSSYFHMRCLEIANSGLIDTRNPAHQEFIQRFVDIFLTPDWNCEAFNKGPVWLKTVLNAYLNMLGDTVVVSSERTRKYVVQLATLAERALPTIIEITPAAPENHLEVQRVATLLQGTDIWLEGLSEDDIQDTFQHARGIVSAPAMRREIDRLRARAPADSVPLVGYLLEGHVIPEGMRDGASRDFGDQDWERATRGVAYLLDKKSYEGAIETFVSTTSCSCYRSWYDNRDGDIHPATFAPPPFFLYADIMLRLYPERFLGDASTLNDTLGTFNHKLIASGDASQMLMGYAREITRVSALLPHIAATVSPEEAFRAFAYLLKMKMAYQAVRKEYFKEEDKICGFLKLFTDAADCDMACTEPLAMTFLASQDNAGFNALVSEMFVPMFPEGAKYAEKVVMKTFKEQRDGGITMLHTAPMLLSFAGTEVDCATGVVYRNGYETEEVPPYLRNHPHVRLLELQDLPFARNSAGAFCYYSEAEGKGSGPTLKARIALDPEAGYVIIQKMLPTTFAGEAPKLLQFVPPENHAHIPAAIMQRLGIAHVWQDERTQVAGTDDGSPAQAHPILYGYDAQGKLVAKFKHSNIMSPQRVAVLNDDGEVIGDRFERPQIEVHGADGAVIGHRDDPDQMVHTTYWTVELPTGRYLATKMANLGPYGISAESQRVLDKLLQCVPMSDVFLSLDGEGFVVPSLDVTITKTRDGCWECTGSDLSNWVVDLDSDIPILSLRQKDAQRTPVALVRKRATLARELEEKEAAVAPSLVVKYRIQKLKGEIAELDATIAGHAPQLFLAVQKEGVDAEHLRGQMQASERDIRRLHERLKTEVGADRKAELQQEITECARHYATCVANYQRHCLRTPKILSCGGMPDDCVSPRDLMSTLFLIHNSLSKDDPEQYVTSWITELAKHTFSKPLDKTTSAFLCEVAERCDDNPALKELSLHLKLLISQHSLAEMEEVMHARPDDQAQIASLRAHFEGTQTACLDALGGFDDAERSALPQAVRVLVHKFCPGRLRVVRHGNDDVVSPFPEVAARPLRGLAHQTLMERLCPPSSVTVRAKARAEVISPEQEVLIQQFETHSPEQVRGFYFEKMGYFTSETFCAEFGIQDAGGDAAGFFGVTRIQLETIIQRLVERGWIVPQRLPYYSVTSAQNPLLLFQRGELFTCMHGFPLSEEKKEMIAGRLRRLFLQAGESTCTFAFSDATAELEVNAQLAAEEDKQLSQMLDAEHFLKKEFPELTMVECKRILLTAQYPITWSAVRCEKLRNAMTRYLFHKTELDHVRNVRKAPAVGERNKAELLMTKRQYDVELLFRSQLTGMERVEQIIQMACLLYEADYGHRFNPRQADLFRRMMLPKDHPEAIDAMQARMGFGKTALLPILVLVQIAIEAVLAAEHRSLFCYVVPRPNIGDNAESFNARVASILGSNVIIDKDFSRFHIGEDKAASLRLIEEDLRQRLAFYRSLQAQGVVLIQWPEVRQSMEAQELIFGQMLVGDDFDDAEKAQILECKQLLGQIRSLKRYYVFDELDNTQDFRSREVNFTDGDKTPIAVESLDPLVRLIDCATEHARLPAAQLATRMLASVGWAGAPAEQLVEYVTDSKKSPDDLDAASRAIFDGNPELQTGVLLTRAILLDPNMLAFIVSKEPNTHFGVRFQLREGKRTYYWDSLSKSPLLIAVPYEGTNTPKGMSVFDNTEVAAIATLRYYRSTETQLGIEPHLQFLMTQMRQGTIPPHLYEHVNEVTSASGQRFLDRMKVLALLQDKDEIARAQEQFHKDFLETPARQVRLFLGMAIVAIQVRSDAGRATSDRLEVGSIHDVLRGCSGTMEGTSSYFVRTKFDPSSDGMMSLDIMGRPENARCYVLPTPRESGMGYLRETLQGLLRHSNPNTRAIIDAAGICKSPDGTPETVVEELWTLLKARGSTFTGMKGIVYYGKDGIKRLYRGPGQVAIPCTTAMELAALGGREYFSYYGQGNTRGSDIKQADGAHAVVTLDENVSNSDAKQAVLRFRSLARRESGQSFSFVLTQKYHTLLQAYAAEAAPPDAARARELRRLQGRAMMVEVMAPGVRKTAAQAALMVDAIRLVGRAEALAMLRTAAAPGAAVDPAAVDPAADDAARVAGTVVDAKVVVNYLRKTEIDRAQSDSQTIFEKELKAHVKQAAAYVEHELFGDKDLNIPEVRAAYMEFLAQRRAISAFVELTITRLADKYGHALDEKAKETFIAEQVQRAKERIGTLFAMTDALAYRIAPHCPGFTPPSRAQRMPKFEFFANRVDRSAAMFRANFTRPAVRVTRVDTGAMAIAMAQAQAQAEAMAEAQTESLSTTEVHAQQREVPPIVVVSAIPHFEVDAAWLADPRGMPVTNWRPEMRSLIHRDERSDVYVSPHVQARPIASHYAVKIPDASATNGHRYLFVSQEEFDGLMKHRTLHSRNYALFDLRDMEDERDPTLRDMRAAVLNDDSVRGVDTTSTAALRHADVANVAAEHMLPTLEVRCAADTRPYFQFAQFGVHGERSIDIASTAPDATTGVMQLTVAGRTTSIPARNRWLAQAFGDVYRAGGPGVRKIHATQARLEVILEPVLRRMRELEAQRDKIRAEEARAAAIVAGTAAFVLTPEMIAGLNERDREYAHRAEHLRLCGAEFQRETAEITRLQGEFRATPNPVSLAALQTAFAQFISPAFIQFRGNLTQRLVFDRNTWDDRGAGMPVFDRVYGRIVHSVHSSYPESAARCTRQDCHDMFATTLPAIRAAVTTVTTAGGQLQGIWDNIARIEREIAELEKQLVEAREAQACMREFVANQTAIEDDLRRGGVQFSDHAGTFFDFFHFEHIATAPAVAGGPPPAPSVWSVPLQATVQGTLPEFRRTVAQGYAWYRDLIHSLSERETDVLRAYEHTLRGVLARAGQVEHRPGEVHHVRIPPAPVAVAVV